MFSQEEDITYTGTTFDQVVYPEKTIAKQHFDGCTFTQCMLNGVRFENCRFDDCVFDGCDLSMITMKRTVFNRVQISRSKALGISWYEVEIPFQVSFRESNISFSSFYGKPMKGFQFIDCKAEEVNFGECNLTKANFSGTDLQGAKFFQTDLSEADLTEAFAYFIDPRSNKLIQARFRMPEALTLLTAMEVILE